MNAVEKDEFAHALGQTLEFYGKEMNTRDFAFWYRALGDKPIASIKNALLEYVKVGKHAPRPASIIELITESSIPARQEAQLPKPPETNCPPDIARAWMWFIGLVTKDSKMQVFGKQNVSQEDQERYLHIVNHEAQKHGTPDAIPDEFKLREVWG